MASKGLHYSRCPHPKNKLCIPKYKHSLESLDDGSQKGRFRKFEWGEKYIKIINNATTQGVRNGSIHTKRKGEQKAESVFSFVHNIKSL